MSYFQTQESVEQYIRMAEGIDGRELIAKLQAYLPPGASVLELGMGAGKDLDLLAEHYAVTGSDSSDAFIDRYRRSNPQADLVNLDAVSIDTERRFDAIYSNKVLFLFSEEELAASIERQTSVLRPAGIVLHSFWAGDHYEEYGGMPVYHRDEQFLTSAFSDLFEILALDRYAEMEQDDSIVLLARSRRMDA